jgi:hypothetical protein
MYEDSSSVAPIALNILSSLGRFSPELVTEYPLSPSRVNSVPATVLFLKIHHGLYDFTKNVLYIFCKELSVSKYVLNTVDE